MATAFAQMGAIPLKSDLDMDTFFDFNQSTALNSPSTPSAPSSRLGPTPRPSSDPYSNNALSPYDATEERQVFAGPSHEYERFKQQTGYPVGSVANVPTINTVSDTFNPSHAFVGGGFSSGIDDMFDAGYNASWSTGLDIDADVNMDFNAGAHQPRPTVFYPSNVQQPQPRSQEFVDPSSIGGQEEAQSNVGRLWPGMHQQQAQQAAMAKAQAQAHAQQQQRMHFEAQQQQQQHQQQHQQQQQQQQMRLAQQQHEAKQNAARSRAPSYQNDAHTEESISRLLNQMRQNSAVPSMSDEDSAGMLPHVSRMRKEEEEMDEDERLLASEEGKKLSSKERRQLRNKVSARAFRSRRKEYISQLEGEVAVKAQECNDLKTTNRSLAEENSRYRNLIETLLRHPAYVPFIEDFGKDGSVVGASHPLAPASMAPTPAPQEVKHDDRAGGMPMLETPVDLSMLNLNNANGSNFSVPSNAGINFQQPRIYS